jgi:hypothetical protein
MNHQHLHFTDSSLNKKLVLKKKFKFDNVKC